MRGELDRAEADRLAVLEPVVDARGGESALPESGADKPERPKGAVG